MTTRMKREINYRPIGYVGHTYDTGIYVVGYNEFNYSYYVTQFVGSKQYNLEECEVFQLSYELSDEEALELDLDWYDKDVTIQAISYQGLIVPLDNIMRIDY